MVPPASGTNRIPKLFAHALSFVASARLFAPTNTTAGATVLEPGLRDEVSAGRVVSQIKTASAATTAVSFKPHPGLTGWAAGALGAGTIIGGGAVAGTIRVEGGRGAGIDFGFGVWFVVGAAEGIGTTGITGGGAGAARVASSGRSAAAQQRTASPVTSGRRPCSRANLAA